VNFVESSFAGDLLGNGSKLVIINEQFSLMLVARSICCLPTVPGKMGGYCGLVY
jgi:hypothetical protein